jgi:hypothetical protein
MVNFEMKGLLMLKTGRDPCGKKKVTPFARTCSLNKKRHFKSSPLRPLLTPKKIYKKKASKW